MPLNHKAKTLIKDEFPVKFINPNSLKFYYFILFIPVFILQLLHPRKNYFLIKI